MLNKILNKASKGATIIEYALIAALVAIVAIAAMRQLGNTVSEKFSVVASTVGSATVASESGSGT